MAVRPQDRGQHPDDQRVADLGDGQARGRPSPLPGRGQPGQARHPQGEHDHCRQSYRSLLKRDSRDHMLDDKLKEQINVLHNVYKFAC